MGFSSTKNVGERINLLLDFGSILSNYRRISYISILIRSKPGQTDRWLLDATSSLRASLTISGTTITPTPRALEAVHRPEGKRKKKFRRGGHLELISF